MICVTIARQRHRQIIAEHKFLAAQGIPLVELRLDLLQTRVSLKRLLPERPTPVIVTIRRQEDGGKFLDTEASRITLLRSAIVEGVDYVDLEDGVASQIPRYGKTKRIVSYHNFEETPADLDAIFERLASQNADIVKICTMARSQNDNFRMLDLMRRKNATLPTVAFCMGDTGIPSRILAPAFGAPFTYACFDPLTAVAPGQIGYEPMQNEYRADKLTERTQIYGVIADPVGHSLSPIIHNSAFANLEMDDRVYLPFHVRPEELDSFMETCPKVLNLRGLSVTIPHKETVIPKLDGVDDAVKLIGACNTVTWDENGVSSGTNTDYRAAMESFESVCKDDIHGQTALVMGAGGVGKSLAIGLAQRGAKIVLTDIDLPRAQTLAEKLTTAGFHVSVVEWESRHETDARILVNCTPIGMYPKVTNTPFDGSFMRSGMVVFDAVYNPEETMFLRQAREHGCAVVSGLSMFVGQAGLQFRLFTDVEPPLELMRSVVKKATAPKDEW